MGGYWWASSVCGRPALPTVLACDQGLLPVPCRPFIKLKENGRANISRSSSSTSSFSSTAGEGEALEECDSGVGGALSSPRVGGPPAPLLAYHSPTRAPPVC